VVKFDIHRGIDMPFVVDGYNLLHAVKKSFEQLQDISDIRIAKILSVYSNKTRDTGQLVFDGIGPPNREDFCHIESVEVIFSGTEKEADDIIENIIAANTAPKRLVVVSDDRRLKVAAKKRKCQHIDCVSFMMHMIGEIGRENKRQEPPSKNTGISGEETEGWLDEFGF
jgi:uncharacterized protein